MSTHGATPIASRSRIRPSRILVLAVPTAGRAWSPPPCVCSPRSRRARAPRAGPRSGCSALRGPSGSIEAWSRRRPWCRAQRRCWCSVVVVSRRCAASAERTRSTALRCAMVSSQRPRCRGRVEAAGCAPEVEEGLLGDLLGLGRVADDPQDQPVDPGRDGVVQRGERAPRRPSPTPEQLGKAGVAPPPPGGRRRGRARIRSHVLLPHGAVRSHPASGACR